MNRFCLTILFLQQILQAVELNESYFLNTVKQANIQWKFYSYHDMSSNKEALSKLVFTGYHYTLDLRDVEKAIIKLHNESQPWYVRHRGKIGFFAGMSIFSIPCIILLKFFPSLYR